jgi:ComF family protein
MASSAARQALAPLIDAVFPARCPLCGAMLAGHDGLCGACWGQLSFPGDPACGLCAAPIAPDGPDCCEGCMAQPPRHGGIVAATCYDAVSRQLVLRLKHGRQIALAAMMARMIAARLPDRNLSGWGLVPVPLHRWRLWRRGYNQSALLARDLAGLTGGTLMVDALVRHRRTPSLGGLDRAERALALQGAIGAHPRRALQDRRVLLVDDVLTSGATSDACVEALLVAGAREVRIACFARVI